MIRRLINLYWKYFRSHIAYARHLGVVVGNNCSISIRDWSTEPYLIKIGNNVDIAQDVKIHTHGGGRVIRRTIPDFDSFGKVIVEDWAYIGSGAIILPGVTIGEGSLVAAGSVVTKSIPPHIVVGGNPAKFLCTIDEFIARNMQFNTRSKGLSVSEKKQMLMKLDDRFFIKKSELSII